MNRPLLALAACGAALLGLTLAALLLFWPVGVPVGHELRVNVFVGLLVAGVLVYVAAVRLVLRHRLPAAALPLVLGVAGVLRLMLLPAPPLLSSDIYRYVWDGQVQKAGINPYRYIPADPALNGLRDPDVYPLVNRKDYARTIYPPAAQIIFAAVGRLSRTVTGMKVAMVGFEVLAILCITRLLFSVGLPGERVLIYCWNPLTLWSFACDGHVDAAAIGLLAVALLFRARRSEGTAAAFLAGAALIKFIPVLVAPAFARAGTLWRPALVGIATILILYALYVSAGANVLGFLPTYGHEEGLQDGGGIWLLAGLAHVVTLPGWAPAAYLATVLIGYVALGLTIMRGRADGRCDDVRLLCRDTAVLAAYATAAVSPHYPWYLCWLALPSVVAPMPAVVWLSSASVLLYVDPLDDRFLWPSLVYGPALLLTIVAVWRRRQYREVEGRPPTSGVGRRARFGV